MTVRCRFCLTNEHDEPSCERMAQFAVVQSHGIIDPMTADDVNDQLALRMMRERMAKGAYRKLCLDAGVVIPPEVLDLDPDRHLYA